MCTIRFLRIVSIKGFVLVEENTDAMVWFKRYMYRTKSIFRLKN